MFGPVFVDIKIAPRDSLIIRLFGCIRSGACLMISFNVCFSRATFTVSSYLSLGFWLCLSLSWKEHKKYIYKKRYPSYCYYYYYCCCFCFCYKSLVFFSQSWILQSASLVSEPQKLHWNVSHNKSWMTSPRLMYVYQHSQSQIKYNWKLNKSEANEEEKQSLAPAQQWK